MVQIPFSLFCSPLGEVLQHIIHILPVVFALSKNNAVAAEPVLTQVVKIFDQPCPEGVEVDVSDKLKKI
jgi:hypothetical protein